VVWKIYRNGTTEETDVDGRKILKWILKKYYRKRWVGFIWLRTRINVGFFLTRK